MKLLLEVIDDVRALADSLQTLADAVASGEDEKPTATEPVKAETKPQPKQKTLSLEDVRAVLAVKSQEGFTTEVRGLIQKYGADKLSEIDKTHYQALLDDAEELS
jgi:hypothetical protein